jgi:hypothetical protein
MSDDCEWWDVGCKAKEVVNSVTDQLGFGENHFVTQFGNRFINNPFTAMADPLDWGGQLQDALTPGAPDYSGPLDAATQQLLDEKRRRATEANRKDARSSQLARLFLSEDGTNFNTPSNSFMG